VLKGRQTRILRKDQIERLETFRRTAHDGSPAGYSYAQLRLAMGKPCGWETLQRALQGRPVWDLLYYRISEWIERYLPVSPKPEMDGKTAAAGERLSADEQAAEDFGAIGIPPRNGGKK
jgi:hypothetical protein